MKVSEVMIKTTECVGPNDTVSAVEKLLVSGRVPSMTVCDHTKVVGTIATTDIDGHLPGLARSSEMAKVSDTMNHHTLVTSEDEDVVVARAKMATEALSSLPVLDQAGHIVGIFKG